MSTKPKSKGVTTYHAARALGVLELDLTFPFASNKKELARLKDVVAENNKKYADDGIGYPVEIVCVVMVPV